MLEAGPISDTQPPDDTHTLTLEDFKAIPTEMARYREGDPVNRENFVSFVINSFAVSMGGLEAHKLYLEWKRINEGFDGAKAIKNFLEAGGLNALSEAEKNAIHNAYSRVRKHAGFLLSNEAKAVQAAFIEQLSGNMSPTVYIGVEAPLSPSSMRLQGMPFPELVSKIKSGMGK